METLYRKIVVDGKEQYEPAEVGFKEQLPDGIWVIQTKPNSKSITSAAYMVGRLENPVDLVTHASIQSMKDDISKYLMNLKDPQSPEYQDAKDVLGGYLTGAIEFYNVSAHDFATLILRQVAKRCEIDLQTRTRMIW